MVEICIKFINVNSNNRKMLYFAKNGIADRIAFLTRRRIFSSQPIKVMLCLNFLFTANQSNAVP